MALTFAVLKKGGMFGNDWQDRCITIDGTQFHWMKGTTIKGTLDLAGCSVIPNAEKPHAFILKTTKKTLALAMKDQEEFDKATAALKEAANAAPSPPPPAATPAPPPQKQASAPPPQPQAQPAGVIMPPNQQQMAYGAAYGAGNANTMQPATANLIALGAASRTGQPQAQATTATAGAGPFGAIGGLGNIGNLVAGAQALGNQMQYANNAPIPPAPQQAELRQEADVDPTKGGPTPVNAAGRIPLSMVPSSDSRNLTMRDPDPSASPEEQERQRITQDYLFLRPPAVMINHDKAVAEQAERLQRQAGAGEVITDQYGYPLPQPSIDALWAQGIRVQRMLGVAAQLKPGADAGLDITEAQQIGIRYREMKEKYGQAKTLDY